MDAQPPPLPLPTFFEGNCSRYPARSAALWIALVFPLLALAVKLAQYWQVPLPECWLRKLTNIPCPTCGCTRSLLAWTELDLTAAFLFNPLFFLLCVLSVISCAWQLLRRRHQTLNPIDALRSPPFPWLPWFTWRLAGVLLVLNWLYLCWWLPT